MLSNITGLDRQNDFLPIAMLILSGLAVVMHGLFSYPMLMGSGTYLLVGLFFMTVLYCRERSATVSLAILAALILQTFEYARHEFYEEQFMFFLSNGEGYMIARLLVMVFLYGMSLLACVAYKDNCKGAKKDELKVLEFGPLELYLVWVFLNMFAYKNALVSNVLSIWAIGSCFVVKSSLGKIVHFILLGMLLSFPLVCQALCSRGVHDSDKLGGGLNDYVALRYSANSILLVTACFVGCLLLMILLRSRKSK